MDTLEWVSAIIGGSAALFLIGASFFRAWGMTREDASRARWHLCMSIGVLMGLAMLDAAMRSVQWTFMGRLTVVFSDTVALMIVEGMIGVIGGTAVLMLAYSWVVGGALLARRNYRKIGFEIFVIATVALWWSWWMMNGMPSMAR